MQRCMRRLVADLQELTHAPLLNVSAWPSADDFLRWHVNRTFCASLRCLGCAARAKTALLACCAVYAVRGELVDSGRPDDVRVEVVLHLELEFSSTYPAQPPRLHLCTPLPHPNVFPRGERHWVCLDMLEAPEADKTGPFSGWSSAYTVTSVLTQLQCECAERSVCAAGRPVSPCCRGWCLLCVVQRSCSTRSCRTRRTTRRWRPPQLRRRRSSAAAASTTLPQMSFSRRCRPRRLSRLR